MKKLLERFDISKVADVVPGGDSGQASIRHGVYWATELYDDKSIVLVHDGVRPLIDEGTITTCIERTQKTGSAITVVPAIETIVKERDGQVTDIIDRKTCMMANAPQCFILGELKGAHEQSVDDGRDDFIVSASLMRYYGHDLCILKGSLESIKITMPSDFYTFRALEDAREDSQIFGF